MDHVEKNEPKNYSIVACVFFATIAFLSSRCLATIGDYTYIHTDWWEYAVDKDLGAMVYIPTFINTGSDFQKVMERGDTRTHREHGDRISLLSFFKNKESRLIKAGQ
jgi:hypothetical protein